LLVLGAMRSLIAQEPGRRGSRFNNGPGESSGSFTMLLFMQRVRDELKVTPQQAEEIDKIGFELRRRPQPQGIDFFRTATVEQRRAAVKERNEQRDANERERMARLTEVLDESQLKRLRGLGAQRYGAIIALTDDTIAADLMLSDVQRQTLAPQRDDY